MLPPRFSLACRLICEVACQCNNITSDARMNSEDCTHRVIELRPADCARGKKEFRLISSFRPILESPNGLSTAIAAATVDPPELSAGGNGIALGQEANEFFERLVFSRAPLAVGVGFP